MSTSRIGKGYTWFFIEVEQVPEVVVNFIKDTVSHSGLCLSFLEAWGSFPTQSPCFLLTSYVLVMTLGMGGFPDVPGCTVGANASTPHPCEDQEGAIKSLD